MSEWISVEAEIPIDGADILVWCGWHLTAVFTTDKGFYTEDGTNYIFNVSHWQPLPSPPIN